MLLQPARADVVELPGPAGEDLRRLAALLGRLGHALRGSCGGAPPEHRLAAVSSGRRKHWGWGCRGPAAERRAGARRGAGARGAARHRARRARAAGRARGASSCRRRASRSPPALAEICSADTHERASHALGKSYVDVVRGFRGRFEHPPDFVARPRDERDVERAARVVRGRERRRDPLRRRHLGRRRRHARGRPGQNGAVSIDLAALDRPARARPGLALGADRGGRDRARAGGGARRARADAAPLPAVVRALDARRLDRDARRRPLRDASGRTSRTSSSPRARSRRPACGSRAGCRAPAPAPSPDRHARGLGGDPRRDHERMGARAAAARATAPRPGVRFADFARRRASACARSRSRG